MQVICDYCRGDTEKVSGADVYRNRPDLASKVIWRCHPCDAHVGCHPGTDIPLGRLANKELRKAKMEAHAAFDPIWRSRRMSRSKAYAWLAKSMGLTTAQCHIGMFDVAQCRRVVDLVDARNPATAET